MIPHTANRPPPQESNKQREEKNSNSSLLLFKGNEWPTLNKKEKHCFLSAEWWGCETSKPLIWAFAVMGTKPNGAKHFLRGGEDVTMREGRKTDALSAADIPQRKILREMCRALWGKKTFPERTELFSWCCPLARNNESLLLKKHLWCWSALTCWFTSNFNCLLGCECWQVNYS